VLKARTIDRAKQRPAPATDVVPMPDAQSPRYDLQGLRVLIVEDDALTAMEIQAELERSGAEIVAIASSLHEAIALADRDIGAAILDINLDGEMSFPAAELLIGQGIPIVFGTGYDAPQVLPLHLQSVPVFRKPIDMERLVRFLACQISAIAPLANRSS